MAREKQEHLSARLRDNLRRRKVLRGGVIEVEGGVMLRGGVRISGAKNAALPLMITSVLTRETVHLENVPALADVDTLGEILEVLGVRQERVKGRVQGDVILHGCESVLSAAPYSLVSQMRAGFWVLGPLLGRFGEAQVALPGGCAIGARPINYYLRGLEAMGARIEIEGDHVRASGRLRGARIRLPGVSVGATQTLMMAAVLAQGETVIENSAQEPEIDDVMKCLVSMGARVERVGQDVRIRGVDALGGARHMVVADRIEAGTYMLAVGMTGGELYLEGAQARHLEQVIESVERAGVKVREESGVLRVWREGQLRPVDIATAPWPGFPTDLQAQFVAMMTLAKGESRIRETVFENRFMHVPELIRMGARLEVKDDTVVVCGVDCLRGARVRATDLRGSVSLVMAGLAAQGVSRIRDVYHLDRGFETLEKKLSSCGARDSAGVICDCTRKTKKMWGFCRHTCKTLWRVSKI